MDELAVIEAIDHFLMVNFPQIAAHGGESSVDSVDLSDGSAEITVSDDFGTPEVPF